MNMTCKSCEERRQKLKAAYDSSVQSIADAIARITNRKHQADESSSTAEQSTDTADSSAEQSDQRIIVNTRSRAGRRGKSTTSVSG